MSTTTASLADILKPAQIESLCEQIFTEYGEAFLVTATGELPSGGCVVTVKLESGKVVQVTV